MKRAAFASLAALLLLGAARPAAPVSDAAITASICHPLPPHGDPPATLGGWSAGAQLFPGLGATHRPAGTRSAAAQEYFDQGLAWLWGFNHDEATRAFARAAIIDPHCALCFWGAAFAIGPNYNITAMDARRGAVAFSAIRRAQALAANASPSTQALIAALALRLPDAGAIAGARYDALQLPYANAMRAAAARFPADDDIQVLAAEAVMGLNAWKLWRPDGQPAPGTAEVIARLETVLARNPAHAGANHYYIHAVEASPDPGRAEAAADRLGALMPGAGHIVHMPSHIYQRIGRYADGAAANARAARADMAYFLRTAPLDYYAGYTIHNWEFEAFAAAELGRRAETYAALHHADALRHPGGTGSWSAGRSLFARVRFGDWQGVLSAALPPNPPSGLDAATQWSRGMAFAALGQREQARAARANFAAIAAAVSPDATIGFNSAHAIYALAGLVLDARLAAAAGDSAGRIALLTKAVAAEDALRYDEPADWDVPQRPALGQALLDAGRPAQAEAVFREDLRRRPRNAWALAGLDQALRAQGRAGVALTEAWNTADITPTAAF